MLRNLSSKLLILTVGFVMLAEVMIFVPSIAIYRANWLEDHLASGQIAGLALKQARNPWSAWNWKKNCWPMPGYPVSC